jgi:hypothetical protein
MKVVSGMLSGTLKRFPTKHQPYLTVNSFLSSRLFSLWIRLFRFDAVKEISFFVLGYALSRTYWKTILPLKRREKALEKERDCLFLLGQMPGQERAAEQFALVTIEYIDIRAKLERANTRAMVLRPWFARAKKEFFAKYSKPQCQLSRV